MYAIPLPARLKHSSIAIAAVAERLQAVKEHIGRYEYPDAKYFTTCFCKMCGSTLPWTVKTGVNVIVPAGTLDEMPPIEPMQNIFWTSKAGWYKNPAELQCFDEFPVNS